MKPKPSFREELNQSALDLQERRQLALDSEVDLRTLERALAGLPIKPLSRHRIVRALSARGPGDAAAEPGVQGFQVTAAAPAAAGSSVRAAYLKDSDAARYLGFSPSWIRAKRAADTRALKEGRTPEGPEWVLLDGATVRYSVAALDAWVASHSTTRGVAAFSNRGGPSGVPVVPDDAAKGKRPRQKP